MKNRMVIASSWWGHGYRERLIKGYKISLISYVRSEDLMCTIVTVVDNTLLYN